MVLPGSANFKAGSTEMEFEMTNLAEIRGGDILKIQDGD